MGLATIADVRKMADRRELLDLSTYDDKDIQELLDLSQFVIEDESGRVFDIQAKSDAKYDTTGRFYVTDFWPLISVESVTINETVADPEDFKTDMVNGIFHFITDYRIRQAGFRETYDIFIEYHAGYPTVPLHVKRLCLDIVDVALKYNVMPYPGFITQLTESGTIIQFDPANKTEFSIEGRINMLRQLRTVQL